MHLAFGAIVDVSGLVHESGYPLLFVLVACESGGLPIPGETALIAASLLASHGTLSIELVIPIAACAAIVGDNIGYQIGRRGGRWLLERPGRLHSSRLRVLERGEPFFARHGPKAVFLGRFVLGLRVWASWLAGITRMRWPSFVLWNALGGVCWATLVGLAAYLLGSSASNAIEAFGLYGLVALALFLAILIAAHLRHRRELRDPPSASRPAADATEESPRA